MAQTLTFVDQDEVTHIGPISLESLIAPPAVNLSDEQNNTGASLLLRVKQNQIRMMIARGYPIHPDERKVLQLESPTEFETLYRGNISIDPTVTVRSIMRAHNSTIMRVQIGPIHRLSKALSQLYERPAEYAGSTPGIIRPAEVTLVYYLDTVQDAEGEKNTQQKHIEDALMFLTPNTEYQIDNLVIISRWPMTNQAKVHIAGNYNVQHFTYQELCIDRSKHLFVDPHILVYDPEQRKARFNESSPDKMPNMCHDEAQVKRLGLKPGDLVRVESRITTISSEVVIRHTYHIVVARSIFDEIAKAAKPTTKPPTK